MKRDRSPRAASFGLTFSVMLCVVAVSHASAVPTIGQAQRTLTRTQLSAQDEEAVACLFASLHESARQHRLHTTQARLNPPRPVTAGLPLLHRTLPPRPPRLASSPLPLHRLNLPPPVLG